MDKESIRSELLNSLSSISHNEILSLSFGLTRQLIKLFDILPELSSQIGAGYLPLNAEIAPVYQELLKAIPLSLSYPVLIDEKMGFAIPQGMPRGSLWLEKPYHEVAPQWFLVPGVGFDLKGARLGRGKGYYDRYFSEHEGLKIGLAWSGQLKDKIPVESHDSHMDFIITEKSCWDVRRQESF